jgi:ABC-type amino acid transport system permease subunit
MGNLLFGVILYSIQFYIMYVGGFVIATLLIKLFLQSVLRKLSLKNINILSCSIVTAIVLTYNVYNWFFVSTLSLEKLDFLVTLFVMLYMNVPTLAVVFIISYALMSFIDRIRQNKFKTP